MDDQVETDDQVEYLDHHPHAARVTTVAAVFCMVFIGFALTFGMGEWKDTPATASAPTDTTTH